MALSPPAAAAGPPAGAGAMPPPDPAAGAAAMPDAGGGDDSDTVVCTISKTGDGSYMVYAGDEPDGAGSADTSEDDDDAMGGAAGGGSASPAGQPADSIGAALKLALDILQGDASSEGAPGSADDQFQAGFGASKSPTPATGPAQKY